MREFMALVMLPLIVAGICGYFLWQVGGFTKEGWLPTDCKTVCTNNNMTYIEDISNLTTNLCKCQSANQTNIYIQK